MTDGPLINISIEQDTSLTVDEVWPDGDAPADPTAEDVKAAMESSGKKYWVLRDWSLLDDPDVHVYVNGTTARVWNA